jgi:hypothetical protein
MNYIPAVDISQWQGAYKDYGTPIVFMKVSVATLVFITTRKPQVITMAPSHRVRL